MLMSIFMLNLRSIFTFIFTRRDRVTDGDCAKALRRPRGVFGMDVY